MFALGCSFESQVRSQTGPDIRCRIQTEETGRIPTLNSKRQSRPRPLHAEIEGSLVLIPPDEGQCSKSTVSDQPVVRWAEADGVLSKPGAGWSTWDSLLCVQLPIIRPTSYYSVESLYIRYM